MVDLMLIWWLIYVHYAGQCLRFLETMMVTNKKVIFRTMVKHNCPCPIIISHCSPVFTRYGPRLTGWPIAISMVAHWPESVRLWTTIDHEHHYPWCMDQSQMIYHHCIRPEPNPPYHDKTISSNIYHASTPLNINTNIRHHLPYEPIKIPKISWFSAIFSL